MTTRTRARSAITWAVASALLLGAAAALAADDDAAARRIVEHADRANTPPAMVETVRMVLTDEKGRIFERRLRLWSRRRDGGDLALMRFLSPDEIRGAGLLTHEHVGGEDEQWFYLPATRRIRRIAGADRRNRFMGTELLYEDLQGYHPEDHRYRLLRTETLDGERCHVIEAVPADDARAARSAYSRELMWIGVTTAALRKAVFFDDHGERLKVLTLSGIHEVAPGIHLADSLTMENLQAHRTTTLETVERTLPDTLGDEVFSQRNLRRRLRPDER